MSRAPAHAVLTALLVASVAHADDLGETVATKGNGKGSVACVTCHGADGAGNAAAGFPVLAGLDADYVATQLAAVRDGRRTSPVMASSVGSLTDDEIAAVAAYYAAMASPTPAAAPPDAPTSTIAVALVEVGDWPGRDLPSCSSCHGPDLVGVGHGFPRLAGQHASYLATQLRGFREGTRGTDPGDLMGTVARKLTDDEIEALSTWIAAQPAGGAQ